MWLWFEQQINSKYDCHLAQVSPVDQVYDEVELTEMMLQLVQKLQKCILVSQ